jgi:hypothetical protein
MAAKKQNVPNPVLSQDLTFKAEELQQLDKVLDQQPFGFAKVIVQFFQLVRQKRNQEALEAAKKAEVKA